MLTREMLHRLVGADAATRGLAYVREGRVVLLDDVKAGWLHARVQGERADAYRQWIRLERDAKGRIAGIDGQCDCPMAWNCKHVAAAVIARAGIEGVERTTVPPAVATWLDQLERLDARRAAAPAKDRAAPREVMLYVVTAEPDRPFAVRPLRVNVKKDGTLGRSARSYDPDRVGVARAGRVRDRGGPAHLGVTTRKWSDCPVFVNNLATHAARNELTRRRGRVFRHKGTQRDTAGQGWSSLWPGSLRAPSART